MGCALSYLPISLHSSLKFVSSSIHRHANVEFYATDDKDQDAEWISKLIPRLPHLQEIKLIRMSNVANILFSVVEHCPKLTKVRVFLNSPHELTISAIIA